MNITLCAKFERNSFKTGRGIKRNTFKIWRPYWILQIHSFRLIATEIVILNRFESYWHNFGFLANG